MAKRFLNNIIYVVTVSFSWSQYVESCSSHPSSSHPLLSCVQCILPFPGGKHVRANINHDTSMCKIYVLVSQSRSSDDTSGRSQPCGDANQLAEDQTHGHHPQSHQPSAFEDMQHGCTVCRFLYISWILDHE